MHVGMFSKMATIECVSLLNTVVLEVQLLVHVALCGD